MRRPVKGDLVLTGEQQQLSLAFVEPKRAYRAHEYAVLITNLEHELVLKRDFRSITEQSIPSTKANSFPHPGCSEAP